MNWRRWLILPVIVVMLSGCTWFRTRLGNHTEITFAVTPGAVQVATSFTGDEYGTQEILADEITPTHVGVMSLTDDPGHIAYLPLSSDPVSAVVPRDAIYSVMLYGEDLDGRLVPAGPVRIGSLDLDLLPVDEDGASVIDLGVLAGTEEGFVSELAEVEVADALGYTREVLLDFGAYDRQITCMLNPDANGNGIVDYEEDVIWEIFLTVEHDVTAAAATLTPSSALSRADLTSPQGVMYTFWTTEDFGRYFTQPEDLAIQLPTEITDPDRDNLVTNRIFPYDLGPTESGSSFGGITAAGGSVGEGAFGFYSIGHLDPPGPYTGDHVVSIGDTQYRVDAMDFSEHDADLTAMPFPVYELDYDSSGTPTRLEWAWYRQTPDGLLPADPDYVKLMVSEFVVQFGPWVTPGPEGVSFPRPDNWEAGGSLSTEALGDIDLNENFLNLYMRDLYGNTYQNWCRDTYLGPR